MPTPAEILLQRSTLQSGTPWEHLLAQESGTGTVSTLILEDGLYLEMEEELYTIEFSIEDSIVIEDAESNIDVTTDSDEYILEVE